ncbi:hypothetical protein D3C81_1144830 [compost metagenome]
MLVLLIDEFIADPDSFQNSYYSQLYEFTRLLTYIDEREVGINTGSIYKSKQNPKEYLVCITPYCDIHRPELIGNIYKFIVGTSIDPHPDKLKNDSLKFEVTPVPLADNKTLEFVRWSFFHTNCFNKDELENSYEKVVTLKKEYIQKIMNRYITYQARAGVNEPFYMESSFINSFHSFLTNTN